MMQPPDLSGIDIRTVKGDDLTAEDRDAVLALFRASYREANEPYLEKSIVALRNVALATHDGTPAGFALADVRVMDLPRLPGTTVSLAGICCIDAAYRRRRLFGALEQAAMIASGVSPAGPHLACGRIAHPASARTMIHNPTMVPRRGERPSAWHQEIGKAIAAAYGSHDFDPETFVVIGAGTPIGYPVIEIEVEPWEWELFAPVDRSRGDSLLGMCWWGEPPAGWR